MHTFKDNKGNPCAADKNWTWQKILAALSDFVDNCAGKDVEETINTEDGRGHVHPSFEEKGQKAGKDER